MEISEGELQFSLPGDKLSLLFEMIIHLQKDVTEIKRQHLFNIQVQTGFIRPRDYMNAVGIKRTKLNTLISTNKIKSVKKGRKIYIPYSEVARYFNDDTIQ